MTDNDRNKTNSQLMIEIEEEIVSELIKWRKKKLLMIYLDSDKIRNGNRNE